MASGTLVTKEQARGGEELLRRFQETGVEVDGAAWVKTESDAQPYLYIVSSTLDKDATFDAYQHLREALSKVVTDPNDPFSQLNVKLISPSRSVARGIVDWLLRHPDDSSTFYHGAILGDVVIDGAYIYPATLFAGPAAPSA